MTKIACIGEAMIELAMTGVDAAQVGVAGDTLNTAIYLKRAAPQVQVDYITRIGDDPFSSHIKQFIAGNGIGTDHIARMPGSSPGLYAITTAANGERAFTYWRNTAPARRLFEDGNYGILRDYDAVYLSGISMAILPHAVRLELIQWFADNDVTLIYDSNFRPKLWDGQKNAQMVTRALWNRADIALPSIDDEMLLFGEEAHEVEARFTGFQGIGALKRGEIGPMSLGAQEVTQDYPQAPKVVDTTAAGDSFNGGYIAAVMSGKTQAEALRAGHDCAAKVVQFRGAIIPE